MLELLSLEGKVDRPLEFWCVAKFLPFEEFAADDEEDVGEGAISSLELKLFWLVTVKSEKKLDLKKDTKHYPIL